MADLNRELKEYLLQSKQGSGAPSPNPPTEPSSSKSKFGAFLGRIIPQSGPSQSGTNSTNASSWPWSGEPDPCLPQGMTRWQRLTGAGICLVFAAICFGLALLYAPLLLLRARKFALLWSLGSLFALAAVALVRGPSRLLAFPSPAGAVYATALLGTLYAALSLQSTVLTTLGAAVEIAAVAVYVVGFIPGGTSGLRYVLGAVRAALCRGVTQTLPV
ncbi:vesicle transport protein SFT2C [Protopterus annectens]|uniref:vesicle transport protein SFT2C n=1 Tax=Protopterus annectens TaxID=7888 RepID=UPI001CFB14C5|nr:vesicle transport protein SFT2C [Protopterus annectens]XP_043928001.1 vesicle transport protein SFT2C [Protopterus annectens]XP_043928002.1 vesicle transport protein SFT2C [Protopterus annectens]XP_043928003.1 vesicle transport protein SFT2C [Protopterus annectens]XP_043928004.1 vesicle transport protein SFT2C [Protopterus annectens]